MSDEQQHMAYLFNKNKEKEQKDYMKILKAPHDVTDYRCTFSSNNKVTKVTSLSSWRIFGPLSFVLVCFFTALLR